MKTVIMAGGKGTRIASVASDIPKPMIPVEGMPVLEREINSLRTQGFNEIILTVGHLGKIIMDYFGDGTKRSPVTDEPFGVHITYYFENTPIGNAGALFRLKEELKEDFLLLNGDAVFDIDFKRFVDFHRQKGGLATLFTHPNGHPYDSGVVIADINGAVIQWLAKEDTRPLYYKNRVNAGLHVLSPQLLDKSICAEKVDLDRHILKPLAGTGKLFVYDSPEYVKDMGTPERYYDVCRDFASGIVAKRNLCNQQRAIFLDRDGTLNRYVGFLHDIDQLELLPGVTEAIRRINNSGYLAVVITNQPVVARGEVSFEELDRIHDKLETMLGNDGAWLDRIYICPHHPNKGFEGERPELKFDCDCRKPKPGLLLQAAKDLNIDLNRSWMVGDSENDIKAGKNAGCQTALITDEAMNFGQDMTCSSLLGFVDSVL